MNKMMLLFPLLLAACDSGMAPWPTDAPEPADDTSDTGVVDPPTVPEDTDIPPSDPPHSDGPHGYACEQVAVAPGDGIFSLKSFDGQLYSGQFGYGQEATSMLWSYPDWAQVIPGITGIGESICALEVFDGALYANTENSGDILRSTNGTDWSVVYDGAPGVIGCGLHVQGGALYAVNYNYATQSHGRILRSSDGFSFDQVWGGAGWSPYLREITSHQGVLYAFGTNTETDQGFWLSSSNGQDWTLAETPSRFMRGLSWNGALYSGSTDYSSDGPAGIYKTTDGNTTQVHASSKHYVTELHGWDEVLFAGTSAGWKNDTGTSSLLMSRDGDHWQTVCDFDELAVWSIEVHDDALCVGTWEFGGTGKLYRVTIDPNGAGLEDPVDPSPPVGSCDPDPTNVPVVQEINYTQATYSNRHNWVLTCFPYAYTASNYEEHHPCDNLFVPDGSRTGTATFDFQNVPRGLYQVDIRARHTASRNPNGALFIVDGHSVHINQLDTSNDYFWDRHGTWCLEGDVAAVLNSSDAGSDDVMAIRLTPAP